MKMPLIMYPNGFFARSENVPEGGILVIEPIVEDVEATPIEDQTKAVRDSITSTKELKGQ